MANQQQTVAGAAVAMLLLMGAAQAALVFSPVGFPFRAADKHKVLTSPYVVGGSDTKVLSSNDPSVDGGYQVLGRSGAGYDWGNTTDINGTQVYRLKDYKKTDELSWSVAPDAVTFLNASGNTVYLALHFESPVPAVLTVAKLSQNPRTGALSVVQRTNVDWSKYGGLYQPCAGSTSPWGTHLGSEEGDPDARILGSTKWADVAKSSSLAGRVSNHARYWGIYLDDYRSEDAYWAAIRAKFFPYNYGHITEVGLDAAGKIYGDKWFTLGRAGWEMALVMPDNRTLYLADDAGRNVGFFRFVADKANDLSSGTLYAAAVKQTSAANGGSFQVSWIRLGSGRQADLAAKATTTTFAQIFDYAAPTNGTCPSGYKGSVSASSGAECLRLKAGAETLAAFFETRRYASYLGATTEFSKWEGIALDTKRSVLYAALTAVDVGMLKETDRVTADAIQLPENRCGCVYSLGFATGTYTINSMKGLLCGEPDVGNLPAAPNSTVASTCNVENIASPDNIFYVADQDALLIAEDSDYHENNMLWWYDLSTGGLTRLMTAPYAAEVTGSAVFNLNGWTYVWNNLQHPYEDQDAKLEEKGSTGEAAWIGYLGPFKRAGSARSSPAWALSSIPNPDSEAKRHRVQASARVVFGTRQDLSFFVLAK